MKNCDEKKKEMYERGGKIIFKVIKKMASIQRRIKCAEMFVLYSAETRLGINPLSTKSELVPDVNADIMRYILVSNTEGELRDGWK